jgi:hypothetical protein
MIPSHKYMITPAGPSATSSNPANKNSKRQMMLEQHQALMSLNESINKSTSALDQLDLEAKAVEETIFSKLTCSDVGDLSEADRTELLALNDKRQTLIQMKTDMLVQKTEAEKTRELVKIASVQEIDTAAQLKANAYLEKVYTNSDTLEQQKSESVTSMYSSKASLQSTKSLAKQTTDAAKIVANASGGSSSKSSSQKKSDDNTLQAMMNIKFDAGVKSIPRPSALPPSSTTPVDPIKSILLKELSKAGVPT